MNKRTKRLSCHILSKILFGINNALSFKYNKNEVIEMKTCRIKCSKAYSILGEAMPKLDKNQSYVFLGRSVYYPNCMIIKRADKKEYLGNDTWIVPESEIEFD